MTKTTEGRRDPDSDCTPWERTRRALHRHVDTVCDVWPTALLDANSIGFSRGRTLDGTSRGGAELTPVEAAAEQLLEHGSVPLAWLNDLGELVLDLCRADRHPSGVPWDDLNARQPLHDAVEELVGELSPDGRHWDRGPVELVQRLERLASAGAYNWLPVKPGDRVDGIVVGELRSNDVEVCELCSYPILGDGPTATLKRDHHGRPFHTECWYDVQLTRMKPGRPCSVDGCDRPVAARGWCKAHYERWRSTGVIGGAVGVA